MRRSSLALVALVAITLSALGDTTTVPPSGMARRFLRLTSDPAACKQGDAWFNLTSGLYKGCTPDATVVAFTVGGITQAAADLRYLKLAADNDPLTGSLRTINGSAATPAIDSAAGAGVHFTAAAFGIDVAGTTTTICGIGCAAGSSGTYGWSSTADATATADLKLSRIGAKQLGWAGSTAGAITHDFSGLTATRIVTWPDIAGTIALTSSNVATATALQSARTINGDSFDGTGNIQNTLASADFANQGTTATVLHGNASGNPSFGSVVSADLNLTTLTTSGNAGFGTSASGTAGQFVTLTDAADQTTQVMVNNTNNSGTAANASLQALADTANLQVKAHGTGRSTSRFGVTIGGYAELLSSAGNGLLLGTSAAGKPVILGSGGNAVINLTNTVMSLTQRAVTAGTMTGTYEAVSSMVTTCRSWTNAQVTALPTTAGDIAWGTLPAKTIVRNAYIVITGAAVGPATVTVALGRTSATYIDYVAASDAKAAANTVYGDASGERGTNLTGFDLPSYTGTTVVNAHFISTGANLSTVTGSTGLVCIATDVLP